MLLGNLSFLKVQKFWQTCIFMPPIRLFCVLLLIKAASFSSHHDTKFLQDSKNEIIEERCYCPIEIHSSNVFYLKHIQCISELQYSSWWLIFVVDISYQMKGNSYSSLITQFQIFFFFPLSETWEIPASCIYLILWFFCYMHFPGLEVILIAP